MTDLKITAKPPLSRELLILYDDFSEYDAYCAFFCSAVACLNSGREEWLDEISAEGLCLFSQWLKDRSSSLKTELEKVWSTAKEPERGR